MQLLLHMKIEMKKNSMFIRNILYLNHFNFFLILNHKLDDIYFIADIHIMIYIFLFYQVCKILEFILEFFRKFAYILCSNFVTR